MVTFSSQQTNVVCTHQQHTDRERKTERQREEAHTAPSTLPTGGKEHMEPHKHTKKTAQTQTILTSSVEWAGLGRWVCVQLRVVFRGQGRERQWSVDGPAVLSSAPATSSSRCSTDSVGACMAPRRIRYTPNKENSNPFTRNSSSMSVHGRCRAFFGVCLCDFRVYFQCIDAVNVVSLCPEYGATDHKSDFERTAAAGETGVFCRSVCVWMCVHARVCYVSTLQSHRSKLRCSVSVHCTDVSVVTVTVPCCCRQ